MNDHSRSPEQIMQLGMAFWGSKTLLSAVELNGVFTELAQQPLDSDALQARLGLHARSACMIFLMPLSHWACSSEQMGCMPIHQMPTSSSTRPSLHTSAGS